MWYERALIAYLSYSQTFDLPLPNIMLSNGIRLHINDALYSSKFTRNLLSFKDICNNGYHIETMNEDSKKCLYITFIVFGKKLIMEKL